MNTTAFKTKYIAKADRGPLRILHAAIAARRVPRQRLDHSLVGGCHLNHLGACFLPVILSRTQLNYHSKEAELKQARA